MNNALVTVSGAFGYSVVPRLNKGSWFDSGGTLLLKSVSGNSGYSVMWTLGVYFALVLLLVAGILTVSYLLGQRHSDPATGAPYESGILSQGSAHVRFSAKFYLIAMFFVVFDLEAVFLFAWAVAARSMGWQAFWEAVIFVGILLTALVYLWRIGALDWNRMRNPWESK